MKEGFRNLESTAEKVGGGLLFVLGVIAGEYPAAALGAALFVIGLWRKPKSQKALVAV
jgi:hypothetical protein